MYVNRVVPRWREVVSQFAFFAFFSRQGIAVKAMEGGSINVPLALQRLPFVADRFVGRCEGGMTD